eukprot:50631-Eustigmatos_ZCMA.PRE.1
MSVGIPPAPRHGHAMVAVSGGRILVMGGCRIGPQQENRVSAEGWQLQAEVRSLLGSHGRGVVCGSITVSLPAQLRRASQRLSECYTREEQAARVLGSKIAARAS